MSKSPQRANKSNSLGPIKKKITLLRKYKGLDAASKKKINENFLFKILNKSSGKIMKSEGFSHASENLACISQNKFQNTNQPSSMYEKYGINKNKKFTKKRGQQNKMKERGRGISNKHNRTKISTINTNMNQGPPSEDRKTNFTPSSSVELKNMEIKRYISY